MPSFLAGVRQLCLLWLLLLLLLMTVMMDAVGSVVKSRRLCYFLESTNIYLKFYFIESRSAFYGRPA